MCDFVLLQYLLWLFQTIDWGVTLLLLTPGDGNRILATLLLFDHSLCAKLKNRTF